MKPNRTARKKIASIIKHCGSVSIVKSEDGAHTVIETIKGGERPFAYVDNYGRVEWKIS